MCGGWRGRKKAETTNSLGPAPRHPSRPTSVSTAYPDPAFVCGAMNLYLWQSSVWLRDNWNLAKKDDSSLGKKKGSGPPMRASTPSMLKIRSDKQTYTVHKGF